MVKKLIEYFVAHIVDKPEVITLGEVESVNKTIIEIRVAPQDLAKVIGKEGRTFKALRALLHTVDPKSNKDIVVDIVV